MQIFSSYKVKIKHYNKIFEETVGLYRGAVSFFIEVCEKEWVNLEPINNLYRKSYVEKITLPTKAHPEVKYNFNDRFYKMPTGLRRAAITEAIGCYSSYISKYRDWEKNKKGKEPKLRLERNVMPTFYKGSMFIKTDSNKARIKIFHRNDWVWLDIELNNQDVKYIERYCKMKKEHVPTLKKEGKSWYLVFPYEDNVKLSKVDIQDQLICAVDLGINNNATCVIMQPNGTVIDRKFIDLAIEKDHLGKAINRVKKAQQNGARKTPTKWKHVNDINKDISRKTAKGIIDFAILYNVDVIVFEYLDTQGKKKGKNKQKLHLWRKKEIQRIVEQKAHINGMRISRVCAWGTSKLAYDGTGRVARGKEAGFATCELCRFQTGKIYNCDLNASYNIGARYYIRELLKSESVMRRLPNQTKDSDYGTGTTRTLSTLIRLNADICSLTA